MKGELQFLKDKYEKTNRESGRGIEIESLIGDGIYSFHAEWLKSLQSGDIIKLQRWGRTKGFGQGIFSKCRSE